MNGQFDSDRIAQIQKELQLRETEDLLEIWQVHDDRDWTPEAFEAMRRILRERLGEEPGRPTMEYFCSECGAQVSLTDRFCPACGANVEELEEAAEDTLRNPGCHRRNPGEVSIPWLAFFSEVDRLPEEILVTQPGAQSRRSSLPECRVIAPRTQGFAVRAKPIYSSAASVI